MHYTIQQIAKIINGNFLRRAGGKAIVKHLLTDSRQLIFPETTLFFALPGVSQDGHAFLEKLYEAGVRSFIVENKEGYEALPDANIVSVTDVLTALQQVAAHHRQQFENAAAGDGPSPFPVRAVGVEEKCPHRQRPPSPRGNALASRSRILDTVTLSDAIARSRSLAALPNSPAL